MSKAYSSLRIASVALMLSLGFSMHAESDWHVVSQNLFAKSVFAHGYMHGYEQGFHNGDLDLQMGRLFRDVKSQTEYKKPVGYRAEFGDKKDFEDGYRTGFLVGYTDSFSGRNFRAVQLLNLRAGQTAPEMQGSDRRFNEAFRSGYETGQRQGLADGRVSDVSRLDLTACGPANGHEQTFAGECEAFRGGYQLGYSDGFANQRESGESFARNRDETK